MSNVNTYTTHDDAEQALKKFSRAHQYCAIAAMNDEHDKFAGFAYGCTDYEGHAHKIEKVYASSPKVFYNYSHTRRCTTRAHNALKRKVELLKKDGYKLAGFVGYTTRAKE